MGWAATGTWPIEADKNTNLGSYQNNPSRIDIGGRGCQT